MCFGYERLWIRNTFPQWQVWVGCMGKAMKCLSSEVIETLKVDVGNILWRVIELMHQSFEPHPPGMAGTITQPECENQWNSRTSGKNTEWSPWPSGYSAVQTKVLLDQQLMLACACILQKLKSNSVIMKHLCSKKKTFMFKEKENSVSNSTFICFHVMFSGAFFVPFGWEFSRWINLAVINNETTQLNVDWRRLNTYYNNLKEDHNISTHKYLNVYKWFKTHLPFCKTLSKDSAVTTFLEPPRQTLNNISVYRTKRGRELCK